jgi:D-3-phosphoglycerate dehydrogenase / 2-oxoglutarate reductase
VSVVILNAEPGGYSDRARATLRSVGELRERELTQAELPAALADVHVLICRLGLQVDRPALEAAPRLRAVATATTGLDHIDLDAARDRDVAVLSLRGEREFLGSIPATAEHTWALLLALLRRLPAAAASVLDGRWERDAFRGRELAGKTLGIVGLGRIGERIARYGRAFDMNVIAFDTSPDAAVEGVDSLPSLAAVAAAADVLSIHVPLDADTQGLIGTAVLAALRPGAVLVNTARGGIVDEPALLAALESGRLAGAALDVVATERGRVFDSPLFDYARRHDNLLITPHVGGATRESMERTEVFIAEKVAAFLADASS